MPQLFHISSALNRQSILAHGLDWTRMAATSGIAGSPVPEAAGVFLCRDEFEAGFFLRMNNTSGPVDVWAVSDIDERELVDAGSGFCYFPAQIPRSQITLVNWPPDVSALPATRAKNKHKQRKKKPRAGK